MNIKLGSEDNSESDWEIINEALEVAGDSEFVKSVNKQMKNGATLSPSQKDALKRIIKDSWDGAFDEED